jgi:TRAP-type C4-dicarboxylate transport system permease small subunit
VFAILQKIEETLIAGGILLMAALTIANVFARSLFGESLAFTEELSQFLIVLVTFVGIGYGASRGRHIRMTAIYDQLPRRGRKALMIVISVTTAFLLFTLAYYAIAYVLTVNELGTVSSALRVPLWLVYSAAPLGFILGGIQYLLTAYRNLRAPEVYISYEHTDEQQSGDEGGAL